MSFLKNSSVFKKLQLRKATDLSLKARIVSIRDNYSKILV